MRARLRLIGIAVFLGGLVWATSGLSTSANPLLGLTIDTRCDTTTHQVTLLTSDVREPHDATLVGQVLINGTWTDSGSQVTVTVPTGATSTTMNLTIPVNGGTAYRARIVSSTLDNSSGVVSNDVLVCTAATATSTKTPTATTTPTSAPTSTMTPSPTSTATPTPTATNTPGTTTGDSTSTPTPTLTPGSAPTATFTPAPSSGGGGGGGTSSSSRSATSTPTPTDTPAPMPPTPTAVPTATPVPVQVGGVQAVGAPAAEVPPPALPAQAAAPAAQQAPAAPPPCLEAASLLPLLDQDTGEQVVDQVTGLPMWLMAGDDRGMVVLGMACAVQAPTGLPATGDGTTLIVVDDGSDAAP